MKKIVLLGDSIRMGYDKYVRDVLANEAEVFYPKENCRFAAYILRCAHEWKRDGSWGDDVDLVHWNAGLWDVIELFGDEPLTSLSYYGEAIARVDKRLRLLFPNAQMVFATSTNVNEEMRKNDFKQRHNAIIRQYNAEAIRALAHTDTAINDLYSLTASFPDAYRSDATHFYTPQGTEAIGGQVAAVIADLLGIKTRDIHMEKFSPERYSEDAIGY